MQKYKIILLLALTSALASCSSFHEGKRVIASDKGNEVGNRDDGELIEGVVRQVECNRPTGFGAVEVQVKRGKIIESTWYKVDSKELCSKEIPSNLIGVSTPLTELGAANTLFPETTISTIRVVDGFVVEVSTVKKVKISDYIKNVKGYESNGTNREVLDWYFQNRKSF